MNWVDEHVPTFFASLPVDRGSIVFLPATRRPAHQSTEQIRMRTSDIAGVVEKEDWCPEREFRSRRQTGNWAQTSDVQVQYLDGPSVPAAAIRELALFFLPRLLVLGPGT